MGYLQCCGGLQECRTFKLIADKKYKIKEMDYLETCPVCGHTVLQLTRIDFKNNVSIYRITNKKARKFFKKYEKDIFEEKKEPSLFIKQQGKFYLNYNEYGRKKRCYSNLSSLKIGLFDNNI